jgi:hypothetical protein
VSEKLLLVGSIPLDTVEEVFSTFGHKLGPHLAAMPDGEVGPRSHWISRVHYQVFVGHPELEILRRPLPDNGVERLHPHSAADGWQFRVKPGVDRVRFGNPGWRLGFARDALNSYFVFKTLREKGVLPAKLRFQVSMPSPASVCPPRIFSEPGDLAKILPGYTEATAHELDTITSKIPAKDLAIQWDCTTEMQDAYGSIAAFPREGMIERNVAQFRTLSPHVPADALLGYHLCFGTLGGWPRFSPDDLAGAVTMANAFVANSGRRVDWVHIPTLDRADDAFYAPLKNLDIKGTQLYLGMIHHPETYKQRIAAARKFAPNFGVGAYCGFGREPPATMPKILEEHARAAEAV